MFVTILRLTAPNSISVWDAPQTLLGSLHCSPDPLAVFKELVSKGREGKGEKMGREKGRTERGAREMCEAYGPARSAS